MGRIEQVQNALLAAAEEKVAPWQDRESRPAEIVIIADGAPTGSPGVKKSTAVMPDRRTLNLRSESPKLRVPSHGPFPVAK